MILLQAFSPQGPSVGSLPIFPQSLAAYVSLALSLLALAAIVWRNGKEKGRMDAHESATTERLDGFGARLNEVKLDGVAHDTEIISLRLEQQRSADDRGVMREKIAANSTAIGGLGDDVREERLAFITMLHNNEKAAAERDAAVRVELAAIKERLNIDLLVKSVMRNLPAPA